MLPDEPIQRLDSGAQSDLKEGGEHRGADQKLQTLVAMNKFLID